MAWTGRWTQVTDKQQASLLLLQREKGTLAMQLDTAKEENDSLRAKNKSILVNSHQADKAQREAAIAALRKDRHVLELEVQALRQQSAVTLKQLRDKNEEMRLAAIETSSLCTQVETMAEDCEKQKQRNALADAQLREADRDRSKLSLQSLVCQRQKETVNILAAKVFCRYQMRRYVNVLLRRWMHFAARMQYQRIQVVRLERRSQHHNTLKHALEWLSLVRMTKRYDRLGFGKESRRLHSMAGRTCMNTWKNLVRVQRILRQTVSLMLSASLVKHFRKFVIHTEHFIHVVRRMRIKIRRWYLIISYRAWRQYKSLKLWSYKIILRKVEKSSSELFADSFSAWSNLMKDLNIMRRVFLPYYAQSMARAFRSWADYKISNLTFRKRATFVLEHWFVNSNYGCLRLCLLRWNELTTSNRIVQKVISRSGHSSVVQVFCAWSHMPSQNKTLKRVVGKMLKSSISMAYARWCEVIFYERRIRKTVRWACHMHTGKTWRKWAEWVWEVTRMRRASKKVGFRKFRKVFNSWVVAMHRQQKAQEFYTVLCVRIASNDTRTTTKNAFVSWYDRYVHDQNLHKRGQQRCQNHALLVWRRVLVVERVFRQRVYRLLPARVSHHEAMHARRVTRVWRVWAHWTRSLSSKLDRFVHTHSKSLLHTCLTYIVLHAKRTKNLQHTADLQLRHGCKLLTARVLYQWLTEIKTSREEALVQDRVMTGAKHCTDSHIGSVCGNVMRCWIVQTVSTRMYRLLDKEPMIRKLVHRNLVQATFHRYVNLVKTEKHHRHIILRYDQVQHTAMLAKYFACMNTVASHGRIVESVQARKLRLYKSRLLRIWQQTAGIVNLLLTFDQQRYRTYSFCRQQRGKRGTMRFMHRWIVFLEHTRILNKFTERVSRRRLSRHLRAWRANMIWQRQFARAIASNQDRRLGYCLHDWSRHVYTLRTVGNEKVAHIKAVHARALVRAWTRAAAEKRYMHKRADRLVLRRSSSSLKSAWRVWGGHELKKTGLRLLARFFLREIRQAFVLWRQGALLLPGCSVLYTLHRLPHRVLLEYVLKQWRKYARKLKAAMFKIHPQFRLMKAWNFWLGLRGKLQTAHYISSAVSSTVQALSLSCVLRQWLYAVTVPASDAEEAIRCKLDKRITLRYLRHLVGYLACVKQLTAAGKEFRINNLCKHALIAFVGIVSYRKQVRVKLHEAHAKYLIQLVADFFYEIKDDVLEGLMLDEHVQGVVLAKTYTVYLDAGFCAFFDLQQEAVMLREKAQEFRRFEDMQMNVVRMKEGFEVLREEVAANLSSMELVNQKYTERNRTRLRDRTFCDLCCAVENQERQYSEAAATIQCTYHRSLMAEAFASVMQEGLAEKEADTTARLHFSLKASFRARHMVVCQLKKWVAYSRKLELTALRKYQIYLIRVAFNELLWASQQSVDPGLIKEMLRARLYKMLLGSFTTFVSKLQRKQLIYQAHIEVRQNSKRQRLRLHWQAWCLSFDSRQRRNERVRSLFVDRQDSLRRSVLVEWCGLWLKQVYIGSKLVLIRTRFFMLHIKAPAMHNWKAFRTNMARRMLVYSRIVRARSIRLATGLVVAWRMGIINNIRNVRLIQGLLLRRRFATSRNVLQHWSRSVQKRIQAGGFACAWSSACARTHMQLWHRLCMEQHTLKERARTYWVIIKALKMRVRRDLLAHSFQCFAENLWGARFLSNSIWRRSKWLHIRAHNGSLQQRAFVTWRRHWIERQQMGEVLRRVLSQRRAKVDLRQPFWSWVRYLEDKLNIRREASLVHTTAKILHGVLEVYGEPYSSDFKIRAERAYTLDDLVRLLKKYQTHHDDLKLSAKLQGSAAPRVVSSGPIPYSHYVTTIGKHHDGSKRLSPPLVDGLLTPNLGANQDVLFPGFTGELQVGVSKRDYYCYPPGNAVPERYLGSLDHTRTPKSGLQHSAQQGLEYDGLSR